MHSKFSFIFYCNIHTAGLGLISEWAKYPVQLKKDPIFVAYDISERGKKKVSSRLFWFQTKTQLAASLASFLFKHKGVLNSYPCLEKKKICTWVERNLISWTKSNKHGNSQFEKNMTFFQTRSISDFKFVKLTIESLDLAKSNQRTY